MKLSRILPERASLIAIGLFAICCISECCSENANKPFESEEIITLIKGGVPEKEIIKQVEKVKVNFALDIKTTANLVRAGCSDKLLIVIKQNNFSKLIITSPVNGARCGAQVKVSGTAEKVDGKHLWLFSHRAGLNMWWPQSGEVVVNDDHSWVQGVYLGQQQDVGFDFEITAIWVDNGVHRQMSDYLVSGGITGHYPGIPLPEGFPSCTVIVKKEIH